MTARSSARYREQVTSPADDSSTIRIGLLGCGNVGAPLVELIEAERDTIARRTGLRLEVAKIAVRSTSKRRGDIDPGLFTTDAAEVAASDDVDLVVEVIGGIEPARSYISDALKLGKPVVTANKELLANVGPELFEIADTAGVDLLFEASVAGGIPLMRPLRESLIGEPISRVMGIVNGTTNYILTRMTEAGASYAEALSEAQSLGYAERDPTADVEGFDAAAKAAIIATVAFGAKVVAGDVDHEGISSVTASDIAFADRLGYVIKLLAVAERLPSDEGLEVAVRVHPAMVAKSHPLASVRESFNAVFVEGDAVGELMFYGRGAGGNPTASAVVGDIIDAAANLRRGTHGSVGTLQSARMRSIDDTEAEYYLNVEVRDRPGVLASVSGVFGGHGVSIRSMEQEVAGEDLASIHFITHQAVERDLRATLAELADLDVVHRVVTMVRVIGSAG